jgi:hypothetical protein
LPAFLLLAACARQGEYGYAPGAGSAAIGEGAGLAPTHYYPPPGPPGDPWGPYVHEAAARYRVPEQWVRAVMRQESGGEEQAVSPVGAMGLMQVMPATYQGLRERYGLGDDPYDPHNNVLAGTAYIREMYDRYGAPGFLAAYNAGPDRVDLYLAGSADLPDETVNYLAAITPSLGNDVPLSGPLAMYASARHGGAIATVPSVASLASGCDLNRAYDPNHPCTSLEQAAAASAPPPQVFVQQAGANGCDLNVAYNPNHPCRPARQQAVSYAQLASAGGCDPDVAFDPDRPCRAESAASGKVSPPATAEPRWVVASSARRPPAPPPSRPVPAAAPGGTGLHLLAIPTRDWAIQVGAFANPGLARAVAEGARAEAPDQLRSAALALPPTPNGGSVLYRARLVHLSASAASDACWRLNQRQLPCVVVQPSRS